MLVKKQDARSESLLSDLTFNLEMDTAIRVSLSETGSSLPRISNHAELIQWREKVLQLGKYVATLPTVYDAEISIEDVLVTIPESDTPLRLRIYRPINLTGLLLPVFYWMHGGALIGGSPEQDDPQMKQIAAEARIIVVSVDYRLAPEFPFPIPLQDCYYGLQYLTKNAQELSIDKSRIAIGGASAGGGLAASLAQWVKKSGTPLIRHQSLTYPMLDNRNITKSSNEITSLGIWDKVFNSYAWNAYLGSIIQNETLPDYAVPALEEDLSSLPSAFIGVGALDLFRDESIEYGLRLMEAGISTEIHFYPGAVHGFDWHVPDSFMTSSFLIKRLEAIKVALKNPFSI